VRVRVCVRVRVRVRVRVQLSSCVRVQRLYYAYVKPPIARPVTAIYRI
jgi:hypothetical protein